jgi:hypothetical protein
MPVDHAIRPRGVVLYRPQLEETRGTRRRQRLSWTHYRGLTKTTGLMEHHRECGRSLGPLTVPLLPHWCKDVLTRLRLWASWPPHGDLTR